MQSLQNYCLNKADLIKRDSIFLREKIFLNLSQTVADQQLVIQSLYESGNNLVKQMKMLQKKIQQFNQKYLQMIADKKKDDGLIKFFKKKLNIGPDKPIMEEVDPLEQNFANLDPAQQRYQEHNNSKNVFRLLEDQVELSSKLKKKYRQEVELLKTESKEFREQYASQMKELVTRLEKVMNSNIIQCEDTFSNFYHYGNHKSESEKKIV